MANKLQVKPKNSDRYLKGLSLAEMDDVEQSVEYALEDPGGTFTMVSKEHSAKLSAMNKTVKSISGDTKYIRKAVDKFDKRLGEMMQAIEDGGSGLPSGVLPMVGTPRSSKGKGPGKRPPLKPKSSLKANVMRGAKAGALRALALAGVLELVDIASPYVNEGIDNMLPDGSKPAPKIETGWGKGLIGSDIAGNLGYMTRQWVIKKYNDVFGDKKPAAKPKNAILNRISYQQNTVVNQAVPQQGIKELTPSERAIIIRNRLKGMSQMPAMDGGFAADGMQYGTAPQATAQGYPGRGGGFKSNYLANPTYPNPSASVGAPAVPGDTSGKKGLAKNQQEAYNALRAEGLSPSAAKIMVANLTGESLRNPADVHADPSRRNPGQKAHGIASWDDARSARIAKQFGKSPEQMTVAEQSKALAWEMKNHYKSAWADLNNEQMPNDQRLNSVIRKFEAPADPDGQTRVRMAHLEKLDVSDGPAPTQTAGSTKPGEVTQTPTGAPVAVVENQGRDARTRKQPIQPQLTAVLDYAAKQAGIDKVEVFSGGQAGKGEGGPRTGSTRHDHGNAGDIYLWKDGKKVNMNTADGREIMKKFATASRQAGATGIGAGAGYMGPEAMHVGFGKEATWGGADWVAEAAAQGKALPPVNAMALMEQNKNASETVMASNNAPIPKSLMKNKVQPISAGMASAPENPKLVERAKTYALMDDINNPARSFPKNRKVMPLTPAETAGKGDMGHVPAGQERLAADKSTVGLLERANAYQMYGDINNPPRAFPTRQTDQPLPEHIARPVAASVTPESNDLLKTAQEMAQTAIDKAKEAAKMVSDYVKGSNESTPQTVNRIPKTSKNPPPLSNPPRSFHRATKTTNPTAKTPGSDSSKTFDSSVDDPAIYQQTLDQVY